MQSTSTRRRRTGGRRFFPRRKVCYFSAEHKSPDYKEVPILRRFVSEWGKIDSRRRTGTRSRHQRKLAIAIKRARFLALLPYTGGHSQIELGRPDRGDRNRRFTPRDNANPRFSSPAVNSESSQSTALPASENANPDAIEAQQEHNAEASTTENTTVTNADSNETAPLEPKSPSS